MIFKELVEIVAYLLPLIFVFPKARLANLLINQYPATSHTTNCITLPKKKIPQPRKVLKMNQTTKQPIRKIPTSFKVWVLASSPSGKIFRMPKKVPVTHTIGAQRSTRSPSKRLFPIIDIPIRAAITEKANTPVAIQITRLARKIPSFSVFPLFPIHAPSVPTTGIDTKVTVITPLFSKRPLYTVTKKSSRVMAMRSDSLYSFIIDIFNPAQQISVIWLVSFMLEPLKASHHN